MNRTCILGTVFCLSLAARTSSGQNVTVQLPTFHVFSVATTVVVPDRGSMYLGGVNRASFGSNTNGVPGLGRLFANRGIGSEVSSSGAHVAATIMDLEEIDRAVLGEAADRRGVASASGTGRTVPNPAIERKAAFIAKHVAKNDRSRLSSNPPPKRQQIK